MVNSIPFDKNGNDNNKQAINKNVGCFIIGVKIWAYSKKLYAQFGKPEN